MVSNVSGRKFGYGMNTEVDYTLVWLVYNLQTDLYLYVHLDEAAWTPDIQRAGLFVSAEDVILICHTLVGRYASNEFADIADQLATCVIVPVRIKGINVVEVDYGNAIMYGEMEEIKRGKL